MKALIVAISVLVGVQGWGQNDTLVFENPKELMEYAFSYFNNNTLTTNYLTNRTIELPSDSLTKYTNPDPSSYSQGDNFLELFSLLEWWDISNSFKRDTVLFAAYNHFYTLDEVRELEIPFYIVNAKVNTIDDALFRSEFDNNSIEPLRPFVANEIMEKNIFYSALFLDSFAYDNVSIVLNENTIVNNTGNSITGITIQNGLESRYLPMNGKISISDWTNGFVELIYQIHFADGSIKTSKQVVEMNKRTKPSLPKQLDGWDFGTETITYTTGVPSITNPEAKFSIYYACADQKLRKPFIIVAGWGPHSDKFFVNDAQGWPASLPFLANQFNQEGLIDNLHQQGFDVVLTQFFPPNAYVELNSEVLQRVIQVVNTRKFSNDSYEENIIMGFSAGALATRLALQIMEKKHLEQGGRHPHTKLYISNDGEHGGANIPLGIQHAVEYLWEYEYNGFPFDGTTYALHYILNAPLSKQILHYCYTQTGAGNSPGQGHDSFRNAYLNEHVVNNHNLNTHLPGYPSFQRMISISNGSSTPTINLSNFSSNHAPYPPQTGAIFFKQNNSLYLTTNRRFEGTFLKHGIHRVFYYEKQPLFKPWRSEFEAKTNNPLILDNAPGGIIFIEKNPIIPVNDLLRSELIGSPNISEDHLFSFTPTILTHDVRNTAGSLPNGYLNYNFKVQKLMYDNEVDAIQDNPLLASNFFGYPHLGYPSNHYTVTPFDALFCWDQNTEHLIGNRKDPNFYTGVYSEMKPIFKNFVVDEAEAFNIFLQNKRIGFYTRPNFPYQVDYEAINGIYMGEHITQKTDFLPFTSEPNAVVDMQAGVEIRFLPGVHLKPGTTFHAYIGEVTCEKGLANDPSNTSESESSSVTHFDRTFTNEQVEPFLYPNPSKNEFSIQWKEVQPIQVVVFDLSGKSVLETAASSASKITHELKQGSYIVKLKIKEIWYVQRLVIQ